MEFPKPQEEHKWLERLVGEWTFEGRGLGSPEMEAHKMTGRETVKSLGGLWIVLEGETVMGGEPGYTHMTVGFDPERGKFVGTWQGSMMNYLWIYEGSLDESGNRLPLESRGPSFATPGQMAPYRDIIEVVSDDHRVLLSETQGEDGQWQAFNRVDYRRVK